MKLRNKRHFLFLLFPLLFLSIIVPLSILKKEQVAPFNFVSDVMKPCWTPIVVSSYHTIRENFFLNTRSVDAAPLESIGDFFLTPSQYLFGGKQVEDGQARQLFEYDELYPFKTLLAVALLPFGDALGILFKGLAYISPEVRKRHHKIKHSFQSTIIPHPLTEFSHLYCEEYIPCLGHKRPSHLTKNQKIEIQALAEMVKLLEAHNIVYWIDCGTCLGAYRYGGIIPWDWDIDLSIFLHDHDNVKNILSTLDPKKYEIQDWSSYSKPKTFLKLYIKETKNFIDIYHYQINKAERTVNYVYTFIDTPIPYSWKKPELKCLPPLNYETLFPLKKAKFDNLILPAPNDVVTFLQSKYGQNLDPTMIWDENSHTYQKIADHPYYK